MEYEASKVVTAPLVAVIILQSDLLPEENKTVRKEIEKKNEEYIIYNI